MGSKIGPSDSKVAHQFLVCRHTDTQRFFFLRYFLNFKYFSYDEFFKVKRYMSKTVRSNPFSIKLVLGSKLGSVPIFMIKIVTFSLNMKSHGRKLGTNHKSIRKIILNRSVLDVTYLRKERNILCTAISIGDITKAFQVSTAK